ncbi:MAG TPA: hypothetical protein VGW98_09385 [Solirubrobacteraceae bacterium]|nr:hypothetical protein [Solirubrobacteraceae bacterium]
MAISPADPGTVTAGGQAPGPAPEDPPEPNASGDAAAPAQPTCANCGSPLSPGQDWCLQCGARAAGSVGGRSPSWRPGASILIATAILALGAAAAAYAALNKGKGRTLDVTRTVAGAPATAPAVTPTVPNNLGTPTTVKPAQPPAAVKPPKIPLTATTPKAAASTPASTTPVTTTSTPARTTPTTATPKPASGEPQQKAILLDTNAASTYNPNSYPASNFGDPGLAIDGDTATGWTAQVDPALAPKMAEGLVVDLKSARKLSALEVITTTPQMTVQVYGSAASTLPHSIADPAWVKLSGSLLVKARHFHIKLNSNAVRFVALWISKAPPGSVGSQQAPGGVIVEGSAPGRVSVNEIELFP